MKKVSTVGFLFFILVVAVVLLIVNPIVYKVTGTSLTRSNIKSIESHVKDIQISIMSATFKDENSDLNTYDLVAGSLSDEIRPVSNIKCDRYTIKDGTVKAASKCSIEGVEETYEFDDRIGVHKTGEQVIIFEEKCENCLYASRPISNTNDGMEYRNPAQNAYLRYGLEDGKLSSNPDACAYTIGVGEICLSPLDYEGNVRKIRKHFRFDENTWIKTVEDGREIYELNGSKCVIEKNEYEAMYCNNSVISVNIDSRGAVSTRENDNSYMCLSFKTHNPKCKYITKS